MADIIDITDHIEILPCLQELKKKLGGVGIELSQQAGVWDSTNNKTILLKGVKASGGTSNLFDKR